ncbi:GntR family transcriptional regulator [Sphaerochaeta sp.]|jgi:DNA-binding GntR family transcriptional regulator|uniref:GntR family transcriptional regulator n=3 Tax=Sphaerochaeta sp. TaxID=1972642 RepID=UPI00258572F1|nr:GntR family transcriptional regulator [Sphaerochaeta sp.]MDD3425210.1 GntR family transcriptional regulator [Sphaerochaeta sp.]
MATRTAVIDQIYDDIRDKILKNEYIPGSKLSENSLSVDYNCSRTPVREAIKRLEQDGFVTVLPQSGSYVKELTLKDYQHIAEIRTYLESLAFRLNCENEVDIAPFAAILDEMDTCDMDKPDEVMHFSDLHFQFHLEMVRASNNAILLTTFSRLNLNTNSLLFYQRLSNQGKIQTQEEHRKILAYLQAHDATKGEKFMFAHLWRKRNAYKRSRV